MSASKATPAGGDDSASGSSSTGSGFSSYSPRRLPGGGEILSVDTDALRRCADWLEGRAYRGHAIAYDVDDLANQVPSEDGQIDDTWQNYKGSYDDVSEAIRGGVREIANAVIALSADVKQLADLADNAEASNVQVAKKAFGGTGGPRPVVAGTSRPGERDMAEPDQPTPNPNPKPRRVV
ncbi:hypothetical protein [Lentzea sp. NPDC004782]|uniref:hypothetical protein n=1 Tax=Lentzea sp. NPDC004782 TaxID=3154458 RepID=UPI0033A1DA39